MTESRTSRHYFIHSHITWTPYSSYWQHSDPNGTAPTISRHKTRPETLLQRTPNSYISTKNSQPRQSDPQNKKIKAKKSSRHQPHNLQVTYLIHHPLCLHPADIIDPANSQQSPNNPEQHLKNHQTFFTKILTKEYEAYMKQKSTTTNLKWTTIFDLL